MNLDPKVLMDVIESSTIRPSSGVTQTQEIDPSTALKFANLVQGVPADANNNNAPEVSSSIYSIPNTRNTTLAESKDTGLLPLKGAGELVYDPSLLSELGVAQKTVKKYQANIAQVQHNLGALNTQSSQLNSTQIRDSQILLKEASVLPTPKKPTLNSPFLGILQEASKNYHSKINQVEQNLADALDEDHGQISGATMLENQKLLAEASAFAAYFSKVAGSLTNAINTLAKTQ